MKTKRPICLMGLSLIDNHSIYNSQPTVSTETVLQGGGKQGDVAKLHCLMLVDEETGLPQRAASLSEAQAIAQILHKHGANSSLPCLKTSSQNAAESDSESEVGSLRSMGHLAKQGGPCRHCGTAAVSIAFVRRVNAHVVFISCLTSPLRNLL